MKDYFNDLFTIALACFFGLIVLILFAPIFLLEDFIRNHIYKQYYP